MTQCTFTHTLLPALAFSSVLSSTAAIAEDCSHITFADVGWSDITTTTAITSRILQALGYQPQTDLLSLPVTYSSMASGDIDIFLGTWLPTMKHDVAKYRNEGSIELLRANLTGAKYTLAVPQYVYDAGVHTFADIQRFSHQFQNHIFAIEPGNDGNRQIIKMIDNNAFGLKNFSVVESSEAGMVSQIKRDVKRDKWIVFLGWEPHPMNSNFDIAYLKGGDDYFGPNYGGATVYTTIRKNYTQACPNVGNLLKNLKFSLTMEDEVMDSIINHHTKPALAAQHWLQTHPDALKPWLAGVTTINGKDGLSAVKQNLNL